MHALIEKKYVVHLHTISVLSFAVLKEGKRLLKNKLKDVNWKWIKYKKPGIDLALEIKKEMLNKINIYILQNHGLIIASNNLNKVNFYLKIIEKKLKKKKKRLNLKKPKKIISIKNYKKPKNKIVQIFAYKEKFFHILKKNKSLYPDHTVFLNNKILVCNKLIKNFKYEDSEKKILIIKKVGVFVKNNITKAEYDMLICLAELLKTIPNNSMLSYLNKKEKDELVNWDKELIRQKFNKV